MKSAPFLLLLGVVGLVTAQSGVVDPALLDLLRENPELVSLLLQNDEHRSPLDKPNVVLLVADDMGSGDLTSYGHPAQEAGFIDQMAAEGLRFTNGYVGDAVCTPSRSAIMTG